MNKNIKFIVSIVIFVILLKMLNQLYYSIEAINGEAGYNKSIIELKDKYDASNSFSEDDISNTKKMLNTENVIYYIADSAYARSEFNGTNILVCGISGDLSKFYSIVTNEGLFFPDKYSHQDSNTVILSQDLAIELFKTTDVVGLYMEIYGTSFKISGITTNNYKWIAEKYGRQNFRAFIPYAAMKQLKNKLSTGNADAVITNVEFTFESTNEGIIKSILDMSGKDSNKYITINYSSMGARVKQYYKLILFLLGLKVIYILFKLLIKLISNTRKKIKDELSDCYFLQSIWNCKKYIAFNLLAILAILSLIIILWNMSAFEVYLVYKNQGENTSELLYLTRLLLADINNLFTYTGDYTLVENSIAALLSKFAQVIFIILLIMTFRLTSRTSGGRFFRHIRTSGGRFFRHIYSSYLLSAKAQFSRNPSS